MTWLIGIGVVIMLRAAAGADWEHRRDCPRARLSTPG
jgi:hypothetical protein